jgi:uncharacterized protein (TIGR02246 family)
MRRAISLCVAMFAAAGIAQPGAAQTSGKLDPTIVKLADTYLKAYLAADANAIAALYAEDAIEMPPHQPPIKGRANILAYYQKGFAESKVSNLTLTHLEAVMHGDSAHLVGTSRETITPKSGPPTEETGKYVVIFKQLGGQWKVSYAIYNSDTPPKTAAEPKVP